MALRFALPAGAVASREVGHDTRTARDRAHAAAIAIVEAGARQTAETIVALRRRDHEAAVRTLLMQRWRITRALYPGRNPAMWPIEGRQATECLADACRMIRVIEAQRAAGRWTFSVDPSRLARLQEAEDALILIITGDEPDEEEAA